MLSDSSAGAAALAVRPRGSNRRSLSPKKLQAYGRDAYRTKSFPLRLLVVLLIGALVFFSTAGEKGWQQTRAGLFGEQSPMTEKSERKLMGSLPSRQINRACKEPLEQDLAELPNIISIQKWSSSKERPRESVSIVTQLSIDRLAVLENQCITWPDPLVAIVYIPMVGNHSGGPPLLPTYQKTSLEDVIRGLDSFHAFMEGTAACAFHMELVGQFIPTSMFPGSYPINSLRNRALDSSPTDLVIQMDADFVATPLLGLPGVGYRDPSVFNQMLEMAGQRTALVLPALELTNQWQDLNMAKNVARNIVIAGKAMARDALASGILTSYQSPEGAHVHDTTDISRWSSMSTPLLYKVPYTPGYEPCLLFSLADAPWYDERFVDYGGGSSTWYSHLAASNFTFVVHPFAFVVHVPHIRNAPQSRYIEAQQKMRQSRMQGLRRDVEAEIGRSGYEPTVRNCKAGTRGEGEQLAAELMVSGGQSVATQMETSILSGGDAELDNLQPDN